MAVEKIIRSEKGIKYIKAPKQGVDHWKVKGCASLYLDVTPKGTKTWFFVQRVNGKSQRFKLGRYLENDSKELVDHNGVSLKSAKELAEALRDDIRAGVDVRAREAAEAKRAKDTFAETRKRFMTTYAGRLAKNTQAGYKSALNHKVVAGWEAIPVHKITRTQVREAIDEIAADAPVMANRVLAYFNKFFNWCAERDLIRDDESIPTFRVPKPLRREKPREQFLTEAGIGIYLKAIKQLEYPRAPYWRFMLLTGQRGDEVHRLRWSDVDFQANQWTQSSDNKGQRASIVPLNDLAVEVLEELKPRGGEYVFANGAGSPIDISDDTANKELDGHISDLAADAGLQEGDLVFQAGTPIRPHDLRRTITTHLRKAGVSRDVCDKLLNHAEQGVTAVHYDMYDMLDEKTRAVEQWGRLVQRIESGQPASNVVKLTRSA